MSRPRLRRPVNLCVDWDSTLTTADTLLLLSGIGEARDLRVRGQEGNILTQPPQQWNVLAQQYFKDYQKHKTQHFPREEKVGHEEYFAWLRSLRDVERRSTGRAFQSRVLVGARSQDVESAARVAVGKGKLRLREGWRELFELFIPEADASPTDADHAALSQIRIISVNWSKSFIRWALYWATFQDVAVHGTDRVSSERLRQYINGVKIFANEIVGLDLPLGSSGAIQHDVATSADKVYHLPPAHTKSVAERSPITAAEFKEYGIADRCRDPLVYVGDSATDYECLAAADIGIWLSDVPDDEYKDKFHETFNPLDREIKPLCDTHEQVLEAGQLFTGLFWAKDLKAVWTALLDLPPEAANP